jgi:DNA-binding transcriptional LysR family regulator
MQIFARIAELKSFTKTANSLGIQKSSVSNHIQSLENLVGSRLLQRTTRTVELTNDGIEFYKVCKDLLINFDNIESMFIQNSNDISGRIRIDMPNMIAQNVVIPNLKSFIDKYPKINIEISNTDRRVDVIKEGFDCVIRIGELEDSSLIAKTIGNMEMVNCVSNEYIKEYGTPKTIADLDNHYLINYQTVLGNQKAHFEYWDNNLYKHYPMKSKITVNNAIAYKIACLNGLGIIQVPKISFLKHIKQDRLQDGLIQILPHLKHKNLPISIVYPYQKNYSKKSKVFIEWVEELLKNYLNN